MEDAYIRELRTWREWALDLLDGLPVVWKDFNQALVQGLPPEGRAKNHPACLTVKARDDSRRCRHDCALRRDWWRRGGSDPFVFTCHAGLREIRAPALVDGQLLGVWMLGPVRPARGRRPADLTSSSWDSLRPDFPAQAMTVARMLGSHAATLHTARERWLLERKARQARHPGIRRALAIVEQECSADLRAGAVAARVGLAPTRFSIAFKQTTGSTFSDHLQERLMRRATHLLLDVDLPLRAIADRLGYSSPSYFTRAFRRFHGVTPSAWREDVLDRDRI